MSFNRALQRLVCCSQVTAACLLIATGLTTCETIPGEPYIGPIYGSGPTPGIEEPIGVGIGWQVPFQMDQDTQGESELLLTTRIVSGTTREYVLTCVGGPGDSLEWTASTANDVISQLEDIANDTYMILPTDPTELQKLYDDLEKWITSEWMTPEAYYTWTGR